MRIFLSVILFLIFFYFKKIYFISVFRHKFFHSLECAGWFWVLHAFPGEVCFVFCLSLIGYLQLHPKKSSCMFVNLLLLLSSL